MCSNLEVTCMNPMREAVRAGDVQVGVCFECSPSLVSGHESSYGSDRHHHIHCPGIRLL